MASMTGLEQQSDGIVMEFTRCWAYLGQLGMMAKEVITMMEGETTNEVTLRRAQLERILFLVEKASRSEFEEKKTEAKKCNFYNRGFCNRGAACKFVHPPEVCEDYEGSGICGIRRCQKRHLYSCKYVNSELGCARGELLSQKQT